ncbi:MAG: hypothetical protein IPP90_08555 [Gemmatimonadaceae bacterium]|nr:hypothetical protein [Gemmatimonadaceae bacterium]
MLAVVAGESGDWRTVGFTSEASAGNAASVAIIATPTTGWSFAGWSDGNASASRTLTADLATQTLTATFAQSQCTLVLAVNPANGGSTAVTSGNLAGACGRSGGPSRPRQRSAGVSADGPMGIRVRVDRSRWTCRRRR